MAEGVAQHQLSVRLQKLRPSFQLGQELLLEVVAHQLTLRTHVSFRKAAAAVLWNNYVQTAVKRGSVSVAHAMICFPL